MAPPSAVVHATNADLGQVSEVLARAFADDPVQRWVFRHSSEYHRALVRFMAFFVERYFRLGHVYVGKGGRGATLWAPPDRHALHQEDITPLFELIAADVGDDDAAGALAELGRSVEFLPPEPHFYLGIAGVHPDAQGEGLGSRLLEPCLRACDEAGFPAHLESSNPRNLPFYRRHGFEDVAEFRVGGDDGPVMTIMTRQPRSA